MDFLKELFESGALTFEQFSQAVTAKGWKLADLSTGNYVAKKKYDDDVASRDAQVADLKSQISTRDKDLSALKKQIESTDTDSQTKITDLTEKLTKLQGDYDTAKKDYDAKLAKQAYEFAVKDYANTKKFTSAAAKRDFENQLIAAKLQMHENKLMGADDFEKKYREENAEAFVVEPDPNAQGQGQQNNNGLPTFIQPAPAGQNGSAPEVNPFLAAFGFQAK